MNNIQEDTSDISDNYECDEYTGVNIDELEASLDNDYEKDEHNKWKQKRVQRRKTRKDITKNISVHDMNDQSVNII